MIPKQELLGALGSKVSEKQLQEVRPGVYRALLSFSEVSYSVHYFDTTQSFLAPEFDLSRYQDELLAEDYYKNPGPMQWNYYLDFVVSDVEIKEPRILKRKALIEANRSLARKTIASISQVRQFFLPPLTVQADMPEDFRDIWMERFRAHGLDEVMDRTIGLDNVVERFLSEGGIPKAPGKKARIGTVEKLPRFAGLEFLDYRPYPQRREFKFASVNLVAGANAAGKTSLLEGIEQVVCGRTVRNPDVPEKFRIKVMFANGNEAVVEPLTDNKEYRDRDASWYGQTYTTGNELHTSFGRFNFFGSDAAVRFADEIDSGNVGEALKGIVFGPDAQALEERLHSIEERFGKAERSADARKTGVEAELAVQRSTLEILRKQDPSDISVELLKIKFKEAGFGETTSIDASGMAKLAIEVEQALEPILVSASEMGTYTIRDISGRYERNLQAREVVSTIDAKRKVVESQRSAAESKLASSEEKLTKLKRVEVYEKNQAWVLLNAESIGEAKRVLETIRAEAADFAGLDLVPFRDSSSLEQLLHEHAVALQGKEAESAATTKRLTATKEGAQRATLILEEIRLRAAELVNLRPDLVDCPVCGTKHVDPSLGHRIQSQKRNAGDIDVEVIALAEKSQLLRVETLALRNSIATLAMVERLAVRLKVIVIDRSFAEVVEQIRAGIVSLDAGIAQLHSEELRLVSLQTNGFSAPEARTLLAAFAMQAADQVKVDTLLKEQGALLGRSVIECRKAIEEANASLQIEMRKRQEVFVKLGIDTEPSAALAALSLAIESEKRALDQLAQVKRLIPALSEDKDLVEIQANVKELVTLISKQLKQQRMAAELVACQKRVADKETELKTMTVRYQRAKLGRETLASVRMDAGLDKRVDFFLRANAGVVRETFLRIHSPREFANLVITAKEIKLTRANGKVASARELSTGQRAALALSVFLTLNSLLKNGPELILLDDPIVYVDDLNLLSFLDLMRDIAIEGRRQIFFATANSRVGELFRKKFEFLEADFQPYLLTREESQLPDAGATIH